MVRGAVLSLLCVEPHTRERPKKPDEPNPRHSPRNVGLQDLTLILPWHFFISSSIARLRPSYSYGAVVILLQEVFDRLRRCAVLGPKDDFGDRTSL